ncbi:hypothetical protein [Embleya sp. NPDC005575]
MVKVAFRSERAKAKLGPLGVRYGQTSGDIGPLEGHAAAAVPDAMA